MLNTTVEVQHWGLQPYAGAWARQEALMQHILALKVADRPLPLQDRRPTPNYLIFTEHPHVYTLGKSGDAAHLLRSEAELQTLGASYHRTNRGGDMTYHGPGQLVVYPIFDLDNFRPDIHWFMRSLEEVVLLTCADYGLTAGRVPGLTGVWIDHAGGPHPRKICAMGVRASRWVTMHGLALNVQPDLGYFGHIVPCGIADKGVTSLAAELGRPVPLPEAADRLVGHFETVFGITIA